MTAATPNLSALAIGTERLSGDLLSSAATLDEIKDVSEYLHEKLDIPAQIRAKLEEITDSIGTAEKVNKVFGKTT